MNCAPEETGMKAIVCYLKKLTKIFSFHVSLPYQQIQIGKCRLEVIQRNVMYLYYLHKSKYGGSMVPRKSDMHANDCTV
jgi:hypothetical protein